MRLVRGPTVFALGLRSAPALAGMPMVTLTDLASARPSTISFFLLAGTALVHQTTWLFTRTPSVLQSSWETSDHRTATSSGGSSARFPRSIP